MYAGDAATRIIISACLSADADWRMVFLASGLITIGVAIVGLVLLRPSPEAVGLPPPPQNPHSVFGKNDTEQDRGGESAQPKRGARAALTGLCGSGMFWMLCVQIFLMGTLREIFETYLSDFLQDHTEADADKAVLLSAVFPLMGCPGVLLSGVLVDKLKRRRNGAIVFINALVLCSLCVGMWYMVKAGATEANGTRADGDAGSYTPKAVTHHETTVGDSGSVDQFQVSLDVVTALMAGIGFTLIGTFSLLGGVFSADIGGKGSSGLACGLIDFASYTGSIIFFFVKPLLSDSQGHTNFVDVFGLFVCFVCFLHCPFWNSLSAC